MVERHANTLGYALLGKTGGTVLVISSSVPAQVSVP